MSNNGLRITIDRRDGSRWYWKLNAYGEEIICHRSEVSPVKAAETAEHSMMQVDLTRHYKKQHSA